LLLRPGEVFLTGPLFVFELLEFTSTIFRKNSYLFGIRNDGVVGTLGVRRFETSVRKDVVLTFAVADRAIPAVPLPAGGFLLASGLAAIALYRRRDAEARAKHHQWPP
jgi:hypothetical protein